MTALTDADQRGLSTLLGIHVALYGEVTSSRVCEGDGCGLECGGLDNGIPLGMTCQIGLRS